MKQTILRATWIGLAALLAAGGAAAAAERQARVEGEVVRLATVTAPDGTHFDEVVVRDRNRESVRLRLGEAGACPDCVREGDRIRARLMKRPDRPGTHEVRTMIVRRSGEKMRIRTRSGELIRQRSRVRLHEDGPSGSAIRQRSGASAGHGAGHGGRGRRG